MSAIDPEDARYIADIAEAVAAVARPEGSKIYPTRVNFCRNYQRSSLWLSINESGYATIQVGDAA